MLFKPMIGHLTENDLYKYSMAQAFMHQAPGTTSIWTWKCRNKDVVFTEEMVAEIREQWMNVSTLRYTEEELEYLKSIVWLKQDFIDWLRNYRTYYNDITISYDASVPCHMTVESTHEISNLQQTFYEIYMLAIINETYFRMAYDYDKLLASYKERFEDKKTRLIDGTYSLGAFSEFGLRRRLSAEAQDYAVRELALLQATENKEELMPFYTSYFVGTSNVYLAMKYHVKAVGTMAHEWIMAVGQGNHKHNPAYSNWYALDAWTKEYGTLNGTALTDTITTDNFLEDFGLSFSKQFDGVRHDSGDPYVWGDKMIAHYKKWGIDPKTKTLLFSDSLDFARATAIRKYFDGKAKVAFGIGTYIANDTDAEPLNIVMKLTQVNGQPVAKLSDVEGKGMCKDESYIDYLKRAIAWRAEH